jgi:hypothetical protein
MQAKPGAAMTSPRGKERLKGAALDLLAHADPVVAEFDLDVIGAGPSDRKPHGTRPPVGKGVHQGIQGEVGQHLAIRPGIAVHGDFFADFDIERDRRPLQGGQ